MYYPILWGIIFHLFYYFCKASLMISSLLHSDPTDRVAGRGEIDVGGRVRPARALEGSQVSRDAAVLSIVSSLVTGGHLQHLTNTLW